MIPGNLPIGCSVIYLTIYETKDENQYDQFGCLKWLNEFAEYYNHELQIELDKLRALHSDVNIIYVDYYNAAMTFYRDPTKFGNLLNSHYNLLYVCFKYACSYFIKINYLMSIVL